MKPKPIPHRSVLAKVPSGEIALEVGGDGVFLRFDCDCLDALPHCKAACCALHGIEVTSDELKQKVAVNRPGKRIATVPLMSLTVIEPGEEAEMQRGSDGWCQCLDRTTRRCTIYRDRPATCSEFHCTRGPDKRGWRLDFKRHATHED